MSKVFKTSEVKKAQEEQVPLAIAKARQLESIGLRITEIARTAIPRGSLTISDYNQLSELAEAITMIDMYIK